MGSTLHDGLAAIAASWPDVDIDLIATKAQQTMFKALIEQTQGEPEADAVYFALEQACLVEGLIRGFYKQVWPNLISAFPIIKAIEQEMIYDHNGLRFMSKPDLILADQSEETWAYIEFKSTSTKKAEWINSWNTAIQLHSTIKAVEATLGTAPSVVIVQGLYKGYSAYNKQTSPFCYAYKKAGGASFLSDEVSYEYRAGYKKFPVWEMKGGCKSWVESMPDYTLVDQFPQSPPIYIKEDLVESFFNQRLIREQEIKLALQMLEAIDDEETRQAILNTSFQQKFDQCLPGWGKPCSFRFICHGGVDNPLQSGYTWREPHHEEERLQFEKNS
jgi:hypothetical protein